MSSDENGRCKHGVYVGGVGIDWMCQLCESGVTDEELAEQEARYRKDCGILKITWYVKKHQTKEDEGILLNEPIVRHEHNTWRKWFDTNSVPDTWWIETEEEGLKALHTEWCWTPYGEMK